MASCNFDPKPKGASYRDFTAFLIEIYYSGQK
jgi:hypothetical protein